MVYNRQQFAEKLYSTIMPSNISLEEQSEILIELQECSKIILPKNLFRYRSCSERNISAFYNDELWVTSADKMNDGFDTRLYTDYDKVEEIIRLRLNSFITQDDLLGIANTQSFPKDVKTKIEGIINLPFDDFQTGMNGF